MANSEAHQEVESLSPEIQEVIHRKANWVLRNGIFILLFYITVLLLGTYFISYPDIIIGNVRLTTFNETNKVKAGNDTRYLADLEISKDNFNKIRIGQKILLKFPNQFYSISGEVDSVAVYKVDTSSTIGIILHSSLQRQIEYHDKMLTSVQIFTNDIKLSDRILRQLRTWLKY